jgi:membrane-bound inhibitor of C-type lysozyme
MACPMAEGQVRCRPMCEVRLPSASGCESVATTRSSPVRGNRATGGAASSCDSRAPSRYRVLRAASSRGDPRSVDRECAGRNATSVKDVEPRQSVSSVANQREVVAERVSASPGNRLSEGSTGRKAGTAGVQDHSMHTRQVAVRLRSAATLAVSPRPRPATDGEGLRPDSPAMSSAEVRCLHRRFEAGQRPWSVGRHGE